MASVQSLATAQRGAPSRLGPLSALILVACGLAGALSFALLYGFGLLDPASSVWTMPSGDMAQMLAGYEALLRDPNWRFPPVVTDRLVWPLPVSIVFTDSIPWLVLALRATGLPPEAANPLAIFLLLSHVLQAVATYALLRASGLRHPVPVAAGVVLALLMPAWIARQFGHVALAGHWILLLALALAVSVARARLTAWHAAGLAALAALAAGVHVYHLVPVLGCALAAGGAEVLRGGAGAWRRASLAIGAVAASVGLAAWLLGYGYGGVPAAQAGVLGLYAMDLLGPVLPQGSALAGQRFDGFWFTDMIVPAGGDGFEGYNYLGAGILLLLAGAGTAAIVGRHGESGAVRGRRTFWPLAIVLLALTALAVGPRVHLAAKVLLDLPQPSGRPWNLLYHFRAHGRFFWLPAYALLAWALVVLDRRAPAPITAALCALAVVLQLVDTAEVRRGAATRYAAPMEIPFPGDGVRAGLLQGRRWEFLPTLHCAADAQDHEVIRRLSLVAARSGGINNSAPTARNPITDCAAPVRAALSRREIAPDEMLLLLRRSLPAGMLASAALPGRDCIEAEWGLLCGPGLDGLAGRRVDPSELLAEAPAWGASGRLGIGAPGNAILGLGWSVPEPWGIWSDGKEAFLQFVLPSSFAARGPVVLRLEATGYAPARPSQDVQVYADDRLLATLPVRAGHWAEYVVPLPPVERGAGEAITLRLAIPGAISPAEAQGIAGDPRRLGIGLRRIGLAHPE